MIIDIQDIEDFIFCPVYYKFKKLNIHTPYVDITKKYDEDIHKFTNGYNYFLETDGFINYDKVKQIFGSLWIGSKNQDDFIYIQTGDTNNTYANLRKKGIDNTLEFHDYNLKNQYNPLCFNYKYKVPIMKNLYLTGTIDLIREKNKKVDVVNYISRSNYHTNINVTNNLESIAMAYAFRHIFNQNEDNLVLYLFDKRKEVNLSIDEHSFKKLKINVINIAKSINNNLIYFNSYDRCGRCPHSSTCKSDMYLDKAFNNKIKLE